MSDRISRRFARLKATGRAAFVPFITAGDPDLKTSAALLAASNFGFVGAITHTTVTNTLVILATTPLFSAIFGWLMMGEKVRLRTWLSILAAIAGIVVVSWPAPTVTVIAWIAGLQLVIFGLIIIATAFSFRTLVDD